MTTAILLLVSGIEFFPFGEKSRLTIIQKGGQSYASVPVGCKVVNARLRQHGLQVLEKEKENNNESLIIILFNLRKDNWLIDLILPVTRRASAS